MISIESLGIDDLDREPVDPHGIRAVAQGQIAHPAIDMAKTLLAAFDDLDPFVDLHAREVFGQGRMGVGLAHEEEMPPSLARGLANRLFGIEIVAEIDGLEGRVVLAMQAKPAAAGPAFTVLFFVSVLGLDEGGLQRHRAIVAGRDDRGLNHRMEIIRLGPLRHRGAARAPHLGGAMIFGAVEGDQDVAFKTWAAVKTWAAEAAHGVETAAFLQHRHGLVEQRMKQAGIDGIEHVADVIVAGNLRHLEQRLAV